MSFHFVYYCTSSLLLLLVLPKYTNFTWILVSEGVSWESQNKINTYIYIYISSVHSLSRVQLFVTPWSTAHQASLSLSNSWSPPKPMSIESVMPFSHLILCHPFSWLKSLPASGSSPMNQLFMSGGQSTGASASTSVLPMNIQDWLPEYSLIFWSRILNIRISENQEIWFPDRTRMDWFDLAAQGTLKSLLQHHISKASTLQCSAFFIVQRSHSYMTTGKTTALTTWAAK